MVFQNLTYNAVELCFEHQHIFPLCPLKFIYHAIQDLDPEDIFADKQKIRPVKLDGRMMKYYGMNMVSSTIEAFE